MKFTDKLLRILIAGSVICMFFAVACKKEESRATQQDDTAIATITASSNSQSDAAFADVFNNVMGVNEEVAFGGTGVFARTGSVDSMSGQCYTVQATRVNAGEKFPLKVVIDFGAGCKGKDSVTRKGKIITTYSGPLTIPGKVAETIFDGYYINGIHVEGFHRIENTSTAQSLSFKVNVRDGKITMPTGNYAIRTSNYTISQTEGYGTPLWLKDDVLSIEGSANGTIKYDNLFFTWTSKTVEPLIKRFTCPWIVKGKIEITKPNASAAFIDYGDGSCNNKATLIINNISIEISLL